MTWLSRVIHFDEPNCDDEADLAEKRAEMARRMEHQAKLAAHPCPNDPEYPGEYEQGTRLQSHRPSRKHRSATA